MTEVPNTLLRRQLATIRQAGVAYEFEESRVGLACVASPVRGHDDAASVHAAATDIALTLVRRATLSSGA